MDNRVQAEIDAETLMGVIAPSRHVVAYSQLPQDRLRGADVQLLAKESYRAGHVDYVLVPVASASNHQWRSTYSIHSSSDCFNMAVSKMMYA